MTSPLQPVVLNAARDIAAATITSLANPVATVIPDATKLLAAVATTAAAAAAAGAPTDMAVDGQGECELIGSFAVLVQLALGGLALLSLVFKRWRERPQRPIKIWLFDVSKQVLGSVLVHGANVFMSMLTSGRVTFQSQPIGAVTVPVLVKRLMLLRRDDGEDVYRPNPCSFYLLNLGIDTTIGIPILIIFVRVFTSLAARTSFGQPPESILTGHYGSPPNWRWWFKQSIIYFCGLLGMKLVVLVMFYAFPWLPHVGDWALGWTEGNERLQIVFVMMLFPLIMNAMQYYVIDSFIKKQSTFDGHEHERIPSSEPGDGGDDDPDSGTETDREGGRRSSMARYDVPDNFEVSSSENSVALENDDDLRLHRRNRAGYDSDVDDDAPTIIGSSSSSRDTERGTLLPKYLYPKE